MIAVIRVNGDDGPYTLGKVTLPTCLDPVKFIQEAWSEWREAVPEPESDRKFIVWLLRNKSCYDTGQEIAVVTVGS